MKCIYCNTENKETAEFCRKCGRELKIKEVWKPTLKWHIKTLIIIYASLLILYFFLNWLLQPYLRELPKDITPWLK